MKRLITLSIILIAGGLIFSACQKDFLDVNVDPKAANAEQVQVEYFLNSSITGAQMDPHVAERAYVLYWKNAGRQHRSNGSLALGAYNDGWSSDYYSYLSGWLKDATSAINVAAAKIENGTSFPYTSNMMQVARIWRVYLMSEFTDNFGPMPIDGFQGENPEFKDVKTVYEFMISELKDAASKIDTEVTSPDAARFDKAYGFNYSKWVKYANSMRLRLAMRLSEVNPAYAKTEFEAAAAGNNLILASDESFKVAERDGGWDALSPVMSREWNTQPLSSTMSNLYIGLGGVPSADQLPASIHAQIKPADYMGVKYSDHFGTVTNDPSAGFWYDGLYNTIDPRAYKAFILPGWFDNPGFCTWPSWTQDAFNTQRDLIKLDSDEVLVTIDAAYTWNAFCLGNWGEKGGKNQIATYLGTLPRMSQKYRSASDRVFFGNWETYFLLAEAAVRGWSTPIDAKTAYESGISASFEYFGVQEYLGQYLASESYNRAGTSVNFNHTAEPPVSVSMSYVDGYTQQTGTYNFSYPKNTLYQNGAVSNDLLTKIITQKYLAQFPWLPLEAWNDHRRLGLPFFENPSIELPIQTLPDLNTGNYMQSKVSFFPQRLKYPSSLENSNPEGYQQAISFLGGADEVLTPLWWAKKQ